MPTPSTPATIHHTLSPTFSIPNAAGLRWGGALYVAAIVQYFLAQVVVATAWRPAYNWFDNYISDLGNTACGPFTVPHGAPAYVCSPMHAMMNASFVLAGILTIAGTVLLFRFWPRRRMSTIALALLLVAGLGKILVGFAPENGNVALHLLGAMNLPATSVAILLLSITIRHAHTPLAVTGGIVAVVGLVGTVLSTVGQYAGPALYLGVGAGGMERLAGYPSNLWMLLIGILALTQNRTYDESSNTDDDHTIMATATP